MKEKNNFPLVYLAIFVTHFSVTDPFYIIQRKKKENEKCFEKDSERRKKERERKETDQILEERERKQLPALLDNLRQQILVFEGNKNNCY